MMSMSRNTDSATYMDFDDTGVAKPSKVVDKKKPKRRRRNQKRRQRQTATENSSSNADTAVSKVSFALLPREILQKIFGYCDRPSLESLKSALPRFCSIIEEEGLLWEMSPKLNLDQLPSELLLIIFGYLSRADLGHVAQVCSRFRDLTHAEFLWMTEARNCLVTNGLDAGMAYRTQDQLTSQDRVRISKNWAEGNYHETTLLVQSIRYMPRLQIERSALWVSWGNKIWSHPRHSDGTISRTTNRVLKGHTDDVARFIVKDGLVVSGGRDHSLLGWNASTGDFSFARRYCHSSEVSAVDVSCGGSVVVSGSRDQTVKIWNFGSNDCSNENSNAVINQSITNRNSNNINNNNNTKNGASSPNLCATFNFGDWIWSLAADPFDVQVAVGSAGHYGIPSLHLLDLATGMPTLELGHNLKRGAGMLDLSWQSASTFLSCGYDSCTRLWDTRAGNCVR